MTLTQCNAHFTGFNHMANSTTKTDQYIKTFDAVDDPIVYVLIRTSPYTMDDMILGVFDSRESALTRLKRVMDRPTNDEQFKIETHNLRNYKQEMELDA
jgi:hypothetical protein